MTHNSILSRRNPHITNKKALPFQQSLNSTKDLPLCKLYTNAYSFLTIAIIYASSSSEKRMSNVSSSPDKISRRSLYRRLLRLMMPCRLPFSGMASPFCSRSMAQAMCRKSPSS